MMRSKEKIATVGLSKKEQVRVGQGITGIGTRHISPLLSGRLTLDMLQKMKRHRAADAQFTGEGENEFDKIKKLLKNQKALDEKCTLI